jgi:hypothetical protein
VACSGDLPGPDHTSILAVLHELLESWDREWRQGGGLGGFVKASVLTKVEQQQSGSLTAF